MGPIAAIKTCFRKYATFTGRARRAEFWWFYGIVVALIVAILVGGGFIAAGSLGPDATVKDAQDAVLTVMVVAALFSLVMALPTYAVMARRLRDMGRSGWWAILGLASPIAGLIGANGWILGWLVLIPLVMALFRSVPGTNQFGDPSLEERYRAAARPTPDTARLAQLAREISGEDDSNTQPRVGKEAPRATGGRIDPSRPGH